MADLVFDATLRLLVVLALGAVAVSWLHDFFSE